MSAISVSQHPFFSYNTPKEEPQSIDPKIKHLFFNSAVARKEFKKRNQRQPFTKSGLLHPDLKRLGIHETHKIAEKALYRKG